ncbi:MAG: GDP-mannose 4,6-dehydratase [Thermoplasmataceae archaeon]
METKTALITGITGQDGRLLTRLLKSKGYEVTGLIRKAVNRNLNLMEDVNYIYADVRDSHAIREIFNGPCDYYDEVYHLAAQSDVAYSFDHPQETYDININGTLNILNAVQENQITKVYFAASSEMFGQPLTMPQNEEYPMKPKSPYAVSKLAGYWTARCYREAYKMHARCGILYNHESELRGQNFVTRKITTGIAKYLRDGTPFSLGNIDARKDWGYAPEYVEGMWKIMQAEQDSDYVLATNEQHTVREFMNTALDVAGIKWAMTSENGSNPRGSGWYDLHNGKLICDVDWQLYRLAEADNYKGDASKANSELGWIPKVNFKTLVKIMTEHDLKIH